MNKVNPNLDFTISIPTFLCCNTATGLSEKLRKVPRDFLDKLHPEKEEIAPFVEYVDEGVWKTRVSFQKDSSPSVLRSKLAAQTATPHESLDALCEKELNRRFPLKTLTPTEFNKYKKQIAYSAIDRDDLICTPKIEDPDLRKQLQLANNDSVLQTEHIFAKNSSMNGQSFLRDGQLIPISQAISSPSDRKAKTTTNLRVVQTKNKESICYSGRPETEHKALEQASFIFLNELKTKGKGITKSVDQNGQTVYRLDYVVNSTMSIPWFWGKKSPIAVFPERECIEKERKVFLDLIQKGPVTIEDPNALGTKYQVQFNPIFFSRSANFYTALSNWLPPFFGGDSRAWEISEEGWAGLKTVAENKLNQLQSRLPSKEIEQMIFKIKTCMAELEKNTQKYHLLPEEEWLVRDYLCKLLEIPFVYHCKSSTDRTGIANAVSCALKQWIDLNLPIPDHLCEILKEDRFKELFATNWMAGHQITRYSRGAEGTVAGETLNNNNLGYVLSRGLVQNPVAVRLVPERYLKDFPASEKFKYSAIYLGLLIPLAIFFYLPLTLVAFGRHVAFLATGCKDRNWIGPTRFMLPILPFTLLFNFGAIFPKKAFNEDSPQVGQRALIAGGKYGGRLDNDG